MDAFEASKKLTTLLPKMYSSSEFGRKLYYIQALRPLEGMLPNPNYVPAGLYWDELGRTLGRERLWGPFFELLLEDRPRWKAELVEIRSWCMRVVVFLGASPDALKPLKIAVEARRVNAAIDPQGARDFWKVVENTAVDIDACRKLLLEERPNIVHFAGHASSAGLEVEGDGFGGATLPGHALASLFGVSMTPVDLVVLNACETRDVCQQIARAGVPAVLGTRLRIRDDMAIHFAEGFYSGLATIPMLDEALRAGIANAELKGAAAGAVQEVLWWSPDPFLGTLRQLA